MSVAEVGDQPKIQLCKSVQKYKRKIVRDYQKVEQAVAVWRMLGHKIVMTIGTWDLYHIGHARYIISALEQGDILIVGVDSDRAVKVYKEPGRPAVPEEERMEVLCYLPVELVTIVDDVDEKGRWQYGLLKIVKPDAFVAVQGSYPPEQIEDIRQFAKEVIILPRQAETSTSNMVRNLLKNNLHLLVEKIKESL